VEEPVVFAHVLLDKLLVLVGVASADDEVARRSVEPPEAVVPVVGAPDRDRGAGEPVGLVLLAVLLFFPVVGSVPGGLVGSRLLRLPLGFPLSF